MKKLFVILLMFLLAGCEPTYSNPKITEDKIPYQLFYIEGMPCMRIGKQATYAHEISWGVTCDWSKWKGE